MLATIASSSERVTDVAAEAVDEAFWGLVLGDEELLSAEFDAIIAPEWPDVPVHTAGRGADQHRWDIPAHGRLDTLPPDARAACPGVDGWARQRSPPHAGRQGPVMPTGPGEPQNQEGEPFQPGKKRR